MRHKTVLGLLTMLASAFCFASSGPLAKALYEIGWTPGSVAVIRLAGATLLLTVPSLLALRGRWGEVRRHWKTVVAYGLVAMAGVQIFFFLALEYLSVAVAVLLEMVGAPLMLVAWLWVRSRRFPGWLICAGIVASLVGVVLILDLRGATVGWVGVLLALAAAACLAGYFVLSAKESVRLPPVAFTGLGMGVGAVAALVSVTVGLTPARFSMAEVTFAGHATRWWVPAALLVLTTAGAYWFGIVSLRHIGPTLGSFANLTEVPFSAVTAWIVVGETLADKQLLGGLAILVGIALVKIADARPQPA